MCFRIQLHTNKKMSLWLICYTQPKCEELSYLLRSNIVSPPIYTLVLRVWAGFQCGGSVLCSPSHRMPVRLLTSLPKGNPHRSL